MKRWQDIEQQTLNNVRENESDIERQKTIMKKKINLILTMLFLVIIVVCAWRANQNTAMAPYNLKINLLDTPLGVEKEGLSFSWSMNDKGVNERQTSYRIVIAKGLNDFVEQSYVFDTEWVKSGENVAVSISGLSECLDDNTLYYWAVATKNSKGAESDFSEPQIFLTAMEEEWLSLDGIWSLEKEDGSADCFAFFRNEIELKASEMEDIDRVLLSVTARSPEQTRQYVYNMYVNGTCIGVGPSRYDADTDGNVILYYSTYDITEYITQGANCLGAILYATEEKQFLCQLTAFYKDGSKVVLDNSGSEESGWKVLGGDACYGIDNSIGTGYYFAHANNIDATIFPFGFTDVGFDVAGWDEPISEGEISKGVILKPAPYENVKRFESSQETIRVYKIGNDSYVADLGTEIVGGIRLNISPEEPVTVKVYYGEQLNEDGTVKYKMLTSNVYEETWRLKAGEQTIETIDLMTYRYVQIDNCPVELKPEMICGLEVRSDFEEEAFFESDNELLNSIYALMRNTIEKTTQDLYVDSQSRERAAYEGDALINMISSYVYQDNYATSRFSADYLYTHPTWPAEYMLFTAIMAKTDYMVTGDISSLNEYYEILKGNMYLEFYNEELSMVSSGNDTGVWYDAILTDWPETERDDYDVDVKYNTVFNAVAVKAYEDFADIAELTGHMEEAVKYEECARSIAEAMIEKLYNPATGAFADGLYESGEVSDHYSQHATAYALYGGIYSDAEMSKKMAAFIETQGKIRMSVYGAYFLLDGLYSSDNGHIANRLLLDEDTTEGARTWAYMLKGMNATITTEAWNPTNKDNMTLSHPWGSAPANAIQKGIFGIEPISPGYKVFKVKFQTDLLKYAKICVPTMQGTIEAEFDSEEGKYSVNIPPNTTASVFIPAEEEDGLWVNGRRKDTVYEEGYIRLECGSGIWEFEVRPK